jgi:TetR/AcrR family transcriptional regulator, repressor for uid operon
MVTTMRRTDPDKQLAKRRQIVDAAIICFAKQGFHATSTAQICAQAGMSPGNLFHYFPTKDAIIQAIAELDRQETRGAINQLMDTQSVIEGLQSLAGKALKAARDPVYGAITIEVIAEAGRNPGVAALFAATATSARWSLVQVLQRGIEQGQIDPYLDVDHAAIWLIAVIDGAVSRAALEPEFDMIANQEMLSRLIARFLLPLGKAPS